jgi:integrase/recombinase XerD
VRCGRWRREVKIIGKGNKQRVLFFTDRAVEWLERYLGRGKMTNSPLSSTRGPPRRLSCDGVKAAFKRFVRLACLKKTVTAHVLRHTVATTLFV